MTSVIKQLGRRLRLGVVGGGAGSFIGPVHRRAARFDDAFEIVAGVLSSNAERGRALAEELGIPRAYDDWRQMLEVERTRADGIDVVAIMTPNDLHYPVADRALDLGFDIVCDKPLTASRRDAEALAAKAAGSDRIFCVTYNYSQYPMVRQARALVAKGAIGRIRQIHLTYVQGHNATLRDGERDGTDWRFAGDRAGASLILGDIGSHAHHLGRYVSGLRSTAVMAELDALVDGRARDDYAALLMRWQGGARGTLWVTNSAAGAEHGLAIRIFGETGGFEWHQEQPNALLRYRLGDFQELQTRRLHGALEPLAEHATRIEIGHPEGYQGAFALLYRDIAEAIVARHTGRAADPLAMDFPTVLDGVLDIAFIDAAVQSHREARWVEL